MTDVYEYNQVSSGKETQIRYVLSHFLNTRSDGQWGLVMVQT